MTNSKKLGRPKMPELLKKVFCPVALPLWIKNWMARQEESRAVLIEEALIEKYNLTPPEMEEE